MEVMLIVSVPELGAESGELCYIASPTCLPREIQTKNLAKDLVSDL